MTSYGMTSTAQLSISSAQSDLHLTVRGSASAMSRFPCVSEEDRRNILENVDSKNTKRSTQTSVKILRSYLNAKEWDVQFESLPESELDELLTKFYIEARNESGDMYKKSTLMSYRHVIQRHLQKSRPNIDIVNGVEFRKSRTVFKSMTKELKRVGLGGVDHHPPIAYSDIEKLYQYLCQDENQNPRLLQQKVFVDLMLYFGRRGRENLSVLTRNDFAVTTDAEGALYVYMKRDEKTKNHQDDDDRAEGRMYEIKDSASCPVRSFVKYVKMLNKNCYRLFQQPRKNTKDGCFFKNSPLGHNTLGSMMSCLSKDAGTDDNIKKSMSHRISSKTTPPTATTSARVSDSDIDLVNSDVTLLTDSQTNSVLQEIADDDMDAIMAQISMPLSSTSVAHASNIVRQSPGFNQFPYQAFNNYSFNQL